MEDLKEDEFYQYIVISQEQDGFMDSLNKASLDGWELIHSNSFPVNKPDYLKNSINIVIIYTAILRRKAKLEKKGEDENVRLESGDKK